MGQCIIFDYTIHSLKNKKQLSAFYVPSSELSPGKDCGERASIASALIELTDQMEQ